jgi:hypothetical protein
MKLFRLFNVWFRGLKDDPIYALLNRLERVKGK